jgi:hypothetical protein
MRASESIVGLHSGEPASVVPRSSGSAKLVMKAGEPLRSIRMG